MGILVFVLILAVIFIQIIKLDRLNKKIEKLLKSDY
jgi:hypothetical protein